MGLVSKESSERDARVSLVKVTNSGKKIFNDATVTMNERCQRLLQNLDHGDVDRLLGQMNKIRGLN